jgi:hypothetical protein
MVWWQDLLWGFWNGLTAWIVLIVHAFGGWKGFPFYNVARSGNWYDFGFLLGAGSPLLGSLGPRARRTARPRVAPSSQRSERSEDRSEPQSGIDHP